MTGEGGIELSSGDRLKDGARAVVLGAAAFAPIVGPMLTELLDVALPTVLAIIPGHPCVIFTDAPPLGRTSTEWNNPIYTSNPVGEPELFD